MGVQAPRGRAVTGAAIGLALVVAAAAGARFGRSSGDEAAAAVTTSTSVGPLSASEIYRLVLPSMVLVEVARPEGDAGADGDTAEDVERDGDGIGTGVVVNADGSILTAAHVVDGASAVEVVFADGTRSAAAVASTDPARDVAVLVPAALPEVVVPAVLGGGVGVGDRVVAVGHPLGLVNTTTEGIVSGLDRSVPTGDEAVLEGLIQFDAAVNPGNSGGPLLDERGTVVGIVTALADPSREGFFIGIGFAVPIGAAVGGGAGSGPEQ